jgi:hypothetical protein
MDVGLKALNHQTLRWSSPHLFNDPFEPNHSYSPDITHQKLLTGLIKEAMIMLFGPTEPTGKANRLVAAISRWRDEERFSSEEEAEQVLKQLLNQVAEHQQEDIDRFLSKWQQFAKALRICCFSDKPDNLTCWQHYADNHQGIALRFASGEGTSLKDPQRVSYKSQPLPLTSLKQQIDIAYGKAHSSDNHEFKDNLLTKNKVNNNEREWRCFGSDISQQNDPQHWYNDVKFVSSELQAVYLGLSCEQQHREAISQLIKNQYSKTKIYQAQIIPGQYDIEFTLVD